MDWEEGFQGSLSNVFIAQGDGTDHAFELASGSRIFWPGNQTARGVVTNVTVGFAGHTPGFTDAPLKLKEGTDAYFENKEILGYIGQACNDTFSAIGSSSTAYTGNVFNTMEYDCTRIIDNTSYITLPPSASATGFSIASFWNTPPPRYE
ncbi:hypothetical protein [Microbulbifer sp. 2205BS26-8]|uniref:hypothetical protein n=1 Tax=Microbulbifer sp. 2205BS26-8 TaxID=3064386 RepID=UPI00273D5576|nr:hypothetical protein [Microbulbifer sp. 2205BS26-8]MDP5210168.1 hypothetical protein [Microbulbifer sp. 2205BS26-8]